MQMSWSVALLCCIDISWFLLRNTTEPVFFYSFTLRRQESALVLFLGMHGNSINSLDPGYFGWVLGGPAMI